MDGLQAGGAGALTTQPRSFAFAAAMLLVGTASALLALVGFVGAAPSAEAAGAVPGQGFLPDNRAWELVSPPEKNGGEVIANSGYTRVAADCATDCAVSFASLTGFADAIGLSGAHAQYVTKRTAEPGTSGWSTHAITPAQESPSILGTSTSSGFGYKGDFSDDLSSGVFSSWSPVPTVTDPHPNVEQWQNLYYRDDLRNPGSGTYELLSDAPTSLPFQAGNYPRFRGANAGDDTHEGFTTIAIESSRRLADAPAGDARRLYVHKDGITRFMGQIPSPGDPACGSEGPACATATSTGYAGPVLSDDLSFYSYYANEFRFISADGSRVFFKAPAATSAGLYLRDDQDTPDVTDDVTVRLNQSEKTTPEASQPARFTYASSDGASAFFISTEGLVDGDDNGSADVYRYEHSEDPANDANLTRVSIDDAGPDSPGAVDVLAVTESGEHVYFVATDELVPGQPSLADNVGALYHWHENEVTYVGEFERGEDVVTNGTQASTIFDDAQRTSWVADSGTFLFKLTASDGFIGTGGFSGFDHSANTCVLETSSGAPCRALFVYEPETGSLVCASCNPSGVGATGDARTDVRVGTGGNQQRLPHLSRALSTDGRYVFFSTSESLVPEDTNGPCEPVDGRAPLCTDAYVFDTTTGQRHLLSSGEGNSPSFFMDASESGRDVLIATREQLSGWDEDGGYDIYNARVDGGVAEPTVRKEACLGNDECRPGGGSQPGVPGTGTTTYDGPGNPSNNASKQCTDKRVKTLGARSNRIKAKLKLAEGRDAQRLRKRSRRIDVKVKQARKELRRCKRGGQS